MGRWGVQMEAQLTGWPGAGALGFSPEWDKDPLDYPEEEVQVNQYLSQGREPEVD